jgi:hypothetical protein
MQNSTGASQRSVQAGNYVNGQWLADGQPWRQGTFTPGLAMGVAMVAVSGPGGTSAFYWWADAITLI